MKRALNPLDEKRKGLRQKGPGAVKLATAENSTRFRGGSGHITPFYTDIFPIYLSPEHTVRAFLALLQVTLCNWILQPFCYKTRPRKAETLPDEAAAAASLSELYDRAGEREARKERGKTKRKLILHRSAPERRARCNGCLLGALRLLARIFLLPRSLFLVLYRPAVMPAAAAAAAADPAPNCAVRPCKTTHPNERAKNPPSTRERARQTDSSGEQDSYITIKSRTAGPQYNHSVAMLLTWPRQRNASPSQRN